MDTEKEVSIRTDGLQHAILANSVIFERLANAVLKNKKFRAVLEYDPEGRSGLNIIFLQSDTSQTKQDFD